MSLLKKKGERRKEKGGCENGKTAPLDIGERGILSCVHT
jgi:hypothetical protein